NAVLGLRGFSGGHSHTVVIVDFLNGDDGAFFGDVVKSCLRGAFGHSYDSFLAETFRRPGNASSVVAVGCGKESGLAEFFSQFIRGEYIIRQLADIPSQFFGYVASHGVGTAQNLKSVETEAVGFVLAVNIFYSQKRRQGGKLLQRSY